MWPHNATEARHAAIERSPGSLERAQISRSIGQFGRRRAANQSIESLWASIALFLAWQTRIELAIVWLTAKRATPLWLKQPIRPQRDGDPRPRDRYC
jgi:hypothetical protein